MINLKENSHFHIVMLFTIIQYFTFLATVEAKVIGHATGDPGQNFNPELYAETLSNMLLMDACQALIPRDLQRKMMKVLGYNFFSNFNSFETAPGTKTGLRFCFSQSFEHILSSSCLFHQKNNQSFHLQNRIRMQ